jgi:parallel beta-helix repeat protein
MNNSYGIRSYWEAITTSSHIITNNKIFYNDWAIELTSSRSNTLTGNWLQQNTYGFNVINSPLNNIYHNNVVDNAAQVNTDSSNTWDNGYPSGGNYWSDYKGKDEKSGPNQDQPGSDGIGDTDYSVGFGADGNPLMNKWWEHDILIQNVTATPKTVVGGSTVDINVTVKNNGKISPAESKTFTVTAKYNSSIIGTQSVPNLAQGATQNVIFNWVTTVAPGNYTISAEASTVTDELYTDNNKFTDGQVTVIPLHDVAVRTITSSRTSAYLGYGAITFKVDVKVVGTIGETFDVTLYHNSIALETQTVTLGPGENQTLTFTWDTSTVTPGIYIISATAGPVPDEYYTVDNTLTFGEVTVKIPGDINGDKIVDIADYGVLSAHWYPGPPIGPLGYSVNADINIDGSINVVDVAIVSAHWGQTE